MVGQQVGGESTWDSQSRQELGGVRQEAGQAAVGGGTGGGL